MRSHQYSFPVTPIEGRGEELTSIYPGRRFDLVYASNALDHVDSPATCLAEMAQVMADTGVLYLEGFVREGSKSEWYGLHRHDLVPEGGELVRYGRRGPGTPVTQGLGLTCVYEHVGPFLERGLDGLGYEWPEPGGGDWRGDPWFTMVFRKA